MIRYMTFVYREEPETRWFRRYVLGRRVRRTLIHAGPVDSVTIDQSMSGITNATVVAADPECAIPRGMWFRHTEPPQDENRPAPPPLPPGGIMTLREFVDEGAHICTDGGTRRGDPADCLTCNGRAQTLAALADGPKSSAELQVDTGYLKAMAGDGLVTIDPDPWPGEYVPGNPFIARLPGDTRPWPGWAHAWRP